MNTFLHMLIAGYRRWLWTRTTLIVISIALMMVTMSSTAGHHKISATSVDMVTRRVNAPYFSDSIAFEKRAVFWFGQVNSTSNYADVRVGYDDEQVIIHLNVFDRLAWYDTTPDTASLTTWDAATLYLRLGGNQGNTPDSQSFRFVAQMTPSWASINRSQYIAAYRGNGVGWTPEPIPFSSNSSWRGAGINDLQEDRGWRVDFRIPFSSLGLTGPPGEGDEWAMSLALHDRDDAAGTPIVDQFWPESVNVEQPSSWGQLRFGLVTNEPSPSLTPTDLLTIRHGVNGAVVPDAQVGGDTVCGSGLDFWTEWGSANYAGSFHANVQNQYDLADWPCFSKYYLTFPLDSIPLNSQVVTATLTLYQFGNSGHADDRPPLPTLMQVLTVDEDWNENSITWNNAPLAAENVSQAWVDPIPAGPPYPNKPRQWDVSYAVDKALASQQSLRLVVYSADSAYSSGKYFRTSDATEAVRPFLEILLGDDKGFSVDVLPALQLITPGETVDFQIDVQPTDGSVTEVDIEIDDPFVELSVSPTSLPNTSLPNMVTFSVTDLHDSTFVSGKWYTIPITVTGGTAVQVTNVQILLNGDQGFLPTVQQGN